MASRLSQLRAGLKARNLDGIVIHHLPHVRYLTGFSGSAGLLLVTRSEAMVLTDFRYEQQIQQELLPGIKGIVDRMPYERLVADKAVGPGMSLGFQEGSVTVDLHQRMGKVFKKVKLVGTGSFVAEIVAVKTPEEIASLQKACDIATKVYKQILMIAKPGVRENEIAMEIGYLGRKFGAEDDAFDIIVASGPRGALPHGRASTRKIRKGDMVTLDYGFTYNGFNSDMTRTFAVGEPGAEARKIFDIVLEAEIKGIEVTRAGITAQTLDAACRDHIVAAGYGDRFGHATGHGLGIDVHETPRIAWVNSDMKLRSGMVVTVEPGIYLPGKMGVRIEDDLVVTATGCTILTKAPKKLIIV